MNHRRKWYKVVIKREHPRLEVMKCSPQKHHLARKQRKQNVHEPNEKREKGKEMQKPSKK